MAKINVWLPSRGEGGINVGHASLLADRARTPSYVSWWPNGGVDKENSGTTDHALNDLAADVRAEGGNPIMVDLPCLDDELISQWWERVKVDGFAIPYSLDVLPKSRDYDLFANNCSTIVFRAMVMGGALEIVKFPKFDTITPPHILCWAKTIAAVVGAREWLSSAWPFKAGR